jgi:hypothetical protein
MLPVPMLPMQMLPMPIPTLMPMLLLILPPPGGKKDSWLVDYQATKNVLDVAREQGTSHFVLLSAICVQKPLLEFQKAKLKFEADLQVGAAGACYAAGGAAVAAAGWMCAAGAGGASAGSADAAVDWPCTDCCSNSTALHAQLCLLYTPITSPTPAAHVAGRR